jgi:KDO2-lipid IV(A) lauroyltransferase
MNYLMRRTAVLSKRAVDWLIGHFALLIIRLLQLLPADKAIRLAATIARKVGPLVGRHRVALANLRAAYPEKTDAEIQEIALGMWEHMARLAAEYIYLDQLLDIDLEAMSSTSVEVVGFEHFLKIRDDHGPHILFTAHTGNFELLPVAAAAIGLPVTVLFRAPNNPYIARYILKRRSNAMDSLIASRPGAAVELARILQADGNIGVLVDQKFRGGVKTTFFGRPCLTSPLLPKLARMSGAPVYPARTIRLPGNKFKIVAYPPLVLPRNADGDLDVTATAQMLNDVVEGWVREYPEQWMWFHKRWQM